jgi:hypothetical protein
VVPPTVKGTVSVASTSTSSIVGSAAVKVFTPSGTVIVPFPLSTTPSLKTSCVKSIAEAVPPPSTNG